MQGLVQYALAEPLMDQMVQAPGSFAGAYKAVVIALTGLGGCLILLCLALAAAVRRWDSSAGELKLPMHFKTDLTQLLLFVLPCSCPLKMQLPRQTCCTEPREP